MHAAEPRSEKVVHRGQLRRDSRELCWKPSCSVTRKAPSPAPLARRIGKFEEANGGTLLLDEICEMDVRLQAKLLRAIQEREIDRVGGNRPVPVDIRIIATSNRKLTSSARGQIPRGPLFRLNVVNLKICRRCVNGRPTSANWQSTSSRNIQRPTGCRCVRSPPRPARAQYQSLARQCARAGEHLAPGGPALERSGNRC